MRVLAIDPGTTESGVVIWDGKDIVLKEKMGNHDLLVFIRDLSQRLDHLVIEQIKSYGMSVGQSTFDTCVWSGRFCEAWEYGTNNYCHFLPRIEVKKAICHNGGAKDANIIQALVDRFADARHGKYGKGTKKDQGFFYGFSADIWQAFALAVTFYDDINQNIK